MTLHNKVTTTIELDWNVEEYDQISSMIQLITKTQQKVKDDKTAHIDDYLIDLCETTINCLTELLSYDNEIME